ncbi:MAG: hypothetical protein GH151_08410 [Bacteroidetes bacterium]|nr:hypothetical protein [Bacteroidota bacterium]
MDLPPDFKITTEILWQGTLMFALLDIVFVSVLVWRVMPFRFKAMKWFLVVVTFIFWTLIWFWAIANFWETVYGYLFPGWSRWFIPPFAGLLFAMIALLFWWLALNVSGRPGLSFFILGGLWGSLTHIWAVIIGITKKPPMLQGVDTAPVVIIAFFEFIFYWYIILSLSFLLNKGWEYLRGKKKVNSE